MGLLQRDSENVEKGREVGAVPKKANSEDVIDVEICFAKYEGKGKAALCPIRTSCGRPNYKEVIAVDEEEELRHWLRHAEHALSRKNAKTLTRLRQTFRGIQIWESLSHED
ncbi:MAG: hypothetical protein M1822_007823 [Bathelium mastoideum]|nr:MAG: hypothetical protein M1822_007823 [Bathelium mastoideum]